MPSADPSSPAMKPKSMKTKRRASTIEHLPHDLIVEVVAQVAASSASPLIDLRNIRGTCRSFHRASTERAVARRMAVEKETSTRWWNKEIYLDVLKSCVSAGNPEASFLLGLEYVFRDGLTCDDMGFACLAKAAAGGHDAARYALGILFFGRGDEKLGAYYLDGLAGVSDLSTSRHVQGCRRKVAAAVNNMWIKKFDVAPRTACTRRMCGRIIPESGWEFQQQQFCSRACMWSDECSKFFKNL